MLDVHVLVGGGAERPIPVGSSILCSAVIKVRTARHSHIGEVRPDALSSVDTEATITI